jgi:hypothetical protein
MMRFPNQRRRVLAHEGGEAFQNHHSGMYCGERRSNSPHRGIVRVEGVTDTDEHQAVSLFPVCGNKRDLHGTLG